MALRPRELEPSAATSDWKVMLRMSSDSVGMGMRTESAMTPISWICGMTCSRALAAFVEVRMMLFRALRVRRRSEAPAAGTLSRTLWVFVAAWTVLSDAVMIVDGRRRSMRGLSMCAAAVVVHDAAEI